MKRIVAVVVMIAACGALCALVWPQSSTGEKVSAEVVSSAISAEEVGAKASSEPTADTLELPTEPTAEKGKQFDGDSPAATSDAMSVPKPAPKLTESPTLAIPATTTAYGADQYHTDVYPENVYSEEYLYDSEGNLTGKKTTYPTTFGPDTIWIDGHAYYDVPGFGLIEWSGPNQRTEDYTMYENGNKVGIMGGEDEAPARTSTQPKLEDRQEPTGEVIDQSINGVPEKSGTPPDYKPDTTPPDDPNARIMD